MEDVPASSPAAGSEEESVAHGVSKKDSPGSESNGPLSELPGEDENATPAVTSLRIPEATHSVHEAVQAQELHNEHGKSEETSGIVDLTTGDAQQSQRPATAAPRLER